MSSRIYPSPSGYDAADAAWDAHPSTDATDPGVTLDRQPGMSTLASVAAVSLLLGMLIMAVIA